MCGIAGYIDLKNDGRVDKRVLVDMTDSLIHSGPNTCGYFAERQVGLGGGNQPLYSEDGSIVSICNGEIFNYRELRENLLKQGHSFRTRCDVEVLPHLYEEYGDDFIQLFDGQFAFAIYDRLKRRLLLACDHFGSNPLYYTVTDNLFLFASEIKAILRHPVSTAEVSQETMLKNIRSLDKGQLLLVVNGDVQVREYRESCVELG